MASRFSDLDPYLQPYAQYLYDVAEYNGLKPRVTSTFRSMEKQADLYRRWQQGLSALPAAPPGKSKHNYGLAFDMVVHDGYHSPWQTAVGNFWKSLGGKWWQSDPVHFQVP